ncbi:MAG: GntR family transcriptional regulator [Lacunisphaera sp.]|nr:GntR family transcriptional regulator [Lacunisphaera sp.]
MPEQQIFRTIREQVVHRLRDDVISQIFKPGEDLREFVLAKRYNVSRSPIRDALLQLTQEGLLVATPNCGVKVGYRMEQDIQPLVVEIRLKVEQFALARFIDRKDPAALLALEDSLKRNREACTAGLLPGIIKTDMDFHRTFVEASGADRLLGLWKQVTSAMFLHYDRLHDWTENHREHVAIFTAIKHGNKKRARAALVRNIR